MANGQVQSAATCCICHGHQYGDAYEENGKWCQKCNYCNRIIEVEVNVNEKTSEEQSLVTKEQELNESLTKEQTIDDKTGKTPVDNTLAELSVDLANLAYGLGGKVTTPDGNTVANTEAIKYLEGLGFGNVISYNEISGDHTVGYYIAYKLIEDENGATIPAFSVVIRGSIGDDKLRDPEWRSNFTVGGGDVHYGFKVAEVDLLRNLNQYINDHLENGDKWQDGNYKLWITGHIERHPFLNGTPCGNQQKTEPAFRPCRQQDSIHHMVCCIPPRHPPLRPQRQRCVPAEYTSTSSG